jgi:hypothetical protein
MRSSTLQSFVGYILSSLVSSSRGVCDTSFSSLTREQSGGGPYHTVRAGNVKGEGHASDLGLVDGSCSRCRKQSMSALHRAVLLALLKLTLLSSPCSKLRPRSSFKSVVVVTLLEELSSTALVESETSLVPVFSELKFQR